MRQIFAKTASNPWSAGTNSGKFCLCQFFQCNLGTEFHRVWISMLFLTWNYSPVMSRAHLKWPPVPKVWIIKSSCTGMNTVNWAVMDDAGSRISAWLSWENCPVTMGLDSGSLKKRKLQILLLPLKQNQSCSSSHVLRLWFLSRSVGVSDTHWKPHMDKSWNQNALEKTATFLFSPSRQDAAGVKGEKWMYFRGKMFPRNNGDCHALHTVKQHNWVVTDSGVTYNFSLNFGKLSFLLWGKHAFLPSLSRLVPPT